MHALTVAGLAIWGVTPAALALCAALYLARMFGVTAGYHRYFSHRAFKTSRAGQFLLACLAQSSGQKGVLWWASHHRHHHRHSDTPQDVHSPRQRGLWHAHVGWIFDPRADEERSNVKDLWKFPELRFLQRHPHLPAIALALVCLLTLGLPGLFCGFFLSTVLLYHGTFTINSLSHVWGRRRFATGDDSRNNLLLALLTLGEGWHNNHHRYMNAARQGFYWWQLDITWLALRGLAGLGLVWDLRAVPAAVLAEGRGLRSGAGEEDAGAWRPRRTR